MKRLVLIPVIFFSMVRMIHAQKAELGLQFSPALAWMKPSEKEWKNDGMRFGFRYGVNVDLMFSDHYGIGTGILMAHRGGRLTFQDTLKIRFRFQYLDVPVVLKMRTGEIGYMRYYGIFGMTPGFRLSAKAQNSSGGLTYEEVDIKDDIRLTNISLTIGLGIQYILSGNTRLVAGIEFNNGFSDLLKDDNVKATHSNLHLVAGIVF